MRSTKTLGEGINLKQFSVYSKDQFEKKKKNLIFSPVWGIIDYIKENKNNYEIGVYKRI